MTVLQSELRVCLLLKEPSTLPLLIEVPTDCYKTLRSVFVKQIIHSVDSDSGNAESLIVAAIDILNISRSGLIVIIDNADISRPHRRSNFRQNS